MRVHAWTAALSLGSSTQNVLLPGEKWRRDASDIDIAVDVVHQQLHQQETRRMSWSAVTWHCLERSNSPIISLLDLVKMLFSLILLVLLARLLYVLWSIRHGKFPKRDGPTSTLVVAGSGSYESHPAWACGQGVASSISIEWQCLTFLSQVAILWRWSSCLKDWAIIMHLDTMS